MKMKDASHNNLKRMNITPKRGEGIKEQMDAVKVKRLKNC